MLVSLAVVRVVNWEDLSLSAAPLADVAKRGLGPQGHIIFSGIALFAITNTVLITLVAGSRIICKECRQELETRSERSMKKCEGCQLQ